MMRTIVTTSLQQLTHFMLASHQAGLDVAAQEELEEAEVNYYKCASIALNYLVK